MFVISSHLREESYVISELFIGHAAAILGLALWNWKAKLEEKDDEYLLSLIIAKGVRDASLCKRHYMVSWITEPCFILRLLN